MTFVIVTLICEEIDLKKGLIFRKKKPGLADPVLKAGLFLLWLDMEGSMARNEGKLLAERFVTSGGGTCSSTEGVTSILIKFIVLQLLTS